MNTVYDYDFIVIGSGFGGSVAAHRLTEKGYSVAVLEMGKRYTAKDFPQTNWNLRKYFWLPALKLHGFFRMTLFRHVFVLSGVGVGGGSLVYASTTLEPPERVWDDPKWKDLKDWRSIMPKFFDLAKKMRGVIQNPHFNKADHLLRDAAKAQGFGDTFYPTNVSVYFGEPGKTVPDPYFGGAGPERTGCIYCGGCMVGCRHGAKNTMDKNYLYFAEKQGAKILAETKVTDVIPLNGHADGRDGYEIHTERSTAWFGKKRQVFRCRGVVFSGGVLGTVRLLAECKEKGSLPNISASLGDFVRTNSESIIGVRMHDDVNVSKGVAIGSGIYIDGDTHIEAVRYSEGSDALGPLSTVLTKGKAGLTRPLSWLGTIFRHPPTFLKMLNPFGFAKKTVILLVMQPLHGHFQMRWKRSFLTLFRKRLETENDGSADIHTFIPQAITFAEKMGKQFNGTPLTSLTEIFFDVPTTAHILGGAAMGASPEDGVIDSQNRVFNYKNMYICDGSMIGANLGVNPSLSITALSEHAMSYVKPKAEADWNETGQVTASTPETAKRTALV